MRKISPRIKRSVGYALIASIWLCLFSLMFFFAIVTAIYEDLKAPHLRFLTRGTGLERVAQNFYLSHFRPGWQDQGGYVDFDPELIYVPKIGTQVFQGPEFKVDITFDAAGLRWQPGDQPPGSRVVVTGDSFAMGWGVADRETFSAVLAARYRWPTANCSVSSYGTARELLRLRRLKLLETASCVIIAYCYNDPEENHTFLEDPEGFILKRNPAETWKTLARYHQSQVSFSVITKFTYDHLRARWSESGLKTTATEIFTVPIEPTGQLTEVALAAEIMAADFLRVIDRFPELAEKQIIVTEINDWGRQTRFLPELKRLAAQRPNLTIVPLEFGRNDFFRFDNHLTPAGHEKVAAEIDTALRHLFNGKR